MQISMSVDGVTELSRELLLLAKGFHDTQEMQIRIITLVGDNVQQTFYKAGTNLQNSSSWASLSPRTEKARERGRGYYSKPSNNPGILRWTGNLQDKRSTTVTKVFGQLSMDMGYGIYHQRGGKNLPKRTIIELNDKLKAEIVRVVQTVVYEKAG